jgi:small conductance mechanosensitive channel
MELPQGLGTALLTVATKIAIAVVIVIVGRIVSKLLVGALTRMLRRSDVDETLINFSAKLTDYSLFVLVLLIALGFLGLPMTSIVAVLGASVLAIGIALQDSIANLASGILIIGLRPFGVGDFVEIDNVAGAVVDIGFFNTSLITRQNTTVFVPNKTILDGNLTNYSKTELIRLDLVYGISYADDVLKAKKTLEEIVLSNDHVAKNPPPQVSVSELGESSVNFAVWPYVSVEDVFDVSFAINEQVKLRFDEEGISIPFPQRDIYLYQKNGAQGQLAGEL